jgi:tRNA (adenine22-N1)-methyltransferase
MFGSMLKLSPRMQCIYEHLLPGKPVWDLCCDHGYVGLQALQSGEFPCVHFVDQVPHIIEKLQHTVLRDYAADSARAEFFAGAAENLSVPMHGTVVISGVGAHAILRILQALKNANVLWADRLILGPQRDETLLQLQEFGFAQPFVMEIKESFRYRKLLISQAINKN